MPALRACGAARQVDGHVALFLVDRDLRVDAHRLWADAVVVEEGFGLVDARREGRHGAAALHLRLFEDVLDRLDHGLLAEFLEQLVEAAMGELARRHLRAHVAERGIREADVVADDLEQDFVDLAALVDLELIELQPFLPRIDDFGAGAEPGAHAADIDPVRAHHREHQQLALEEIGHVDDDVVEVLAGDRLVIGDDHVIRLEAVGAVALHARLR